MDSKTNNSAGLQQVLSNSMQNLANVSLKAIKPILDGVISNVSAINKSVLEGGLPAIKIPQFKTQDSDCCPPQQTCPPHCLTSISHCAMQGERIMVPFIVKNTCSQTKTYRIGVRELKDQDGNLAPTQPQLNKQSVTLDPGRSERVLMLIDLDKFNSGSVYTTEIVLREKEINQNICFTLMVDDNCNAVTAEPQDEQKYMLRWQSWQSHFYCEPQKHTLSTNVIPMGTITIKD